MGRTIILLSLALSACTMEYFTLPSGQDADDSPDLSAGSAVVDGDLYTAVEPSDFPPSDIEVPDYGIDAPEDGATFFLDEPVGVALGIDNDEKRYIVYYDINEVGGWFGPPNRTFEIYLAPYQLGDDLVFDIEALLYDTVEQEWVGYDFVTVYGAE